MAEPSNATSRALTETGRDIAFLYWRLLQTDKLVSLERFYVEALVGDNQSRSVGRAMAEPSVQGDEPAVKRRKVRKGTQSCWQCRRRKVRCIFATPTNHICDNCKRRGTTCISQEHLESPVPSALPSTSSDQVEARLDRVENLIQQLVDNIGTTHVRNSLPEDISEPRSTWVGLKDRGQSRLEDRQLADHISNPCESIVIPTESQVEGAASIGCIGRNTVHLYENRSSTSSVPPLERPLLDRVTFQAQDTRAAGKYEKLTSDLIAAWPSQHDLDIICTLPVGLLAYLHNGIRTPYSRFMEQSPPSPREMLQLPPPGSHPVLIARKLLVLGMFLQGVLPSSIQDLEDRGISHHDIMARVVDRAVRLVTTNDDLVRSVEGIECIIIEALYQNYAGNLHQAWMAVRRGIAIAQMMALHRGLNSPSLKFLESETRTTFNPDHICFRLVEMDRYLSLTLGLPQASLESRFATPKALKGCHPIDRMQRMQCAVAGRILQRNDAEVINFAETQDIDRLLQKAAAEMPPQWWLIPNLKCNSSGSVDVVHETMRLMYHFSHNHLLIRLHLPYMLRSSPNHSYDQSKITAVNASRETLIRFVDFRVSNSAHFYCRGCDFIAFTATVVLCIAHIDSRSQRQGPPENSGLGTVVNFLAHSRPSDRGIMERTLNVIETMARAGTDAIASKFAGIIRHLLDIEANAANGAKYTTNSSKGNEKELECDGKLANGSKALHVYIPYLGAINFERRAISKSVPMAPAPSKEGIPTILATDVLLHDRLSENNQQPPSGEDYLPTQSQVGSPLGSSNAQTVSVPLGLLPSPQDTPSATNVALSVNSSNTQNAQLSFLEGIMDAEDDWDLQGVDTALFDSLFREIAIPDVTEVEQETWTQWAENG